MSRKPNAADCSDALQHYNNHKNRYEDRVPCKYNLVSCLSKRLDSISLIGNVTDNLSRTRLRPTGVTGAEYINASFVDVSCALIL